MASFKHSLFSLSRYHRHYDRVKVGLSCRILDFFLYRSFAYPPIHVGDIVEGFTCQVFLFLVRWNCGNFR